MRLNHPLAFAVLGLSLLLSACGGSDDAAKSSFDKEDAKSDAAKAKVPKVAPICPQVAVVRGLDLVRDYGNETPAPEQLVTGAKLLGLDGDCEYTDDGIDVTFEAHMVAKRGPRLGGLHANFPFFVAVVAPDGTILNKNQMSANISFSSDEPLSNHDEALHVFIPLPKAQQRTGPGYQVLAGFQLTPSQADEAKASLKP